MTAPVEQTAYEVGQQVRSSSAYIALVLAAIDTKLTEPFLADLLEWNMMDNALPEAFRQPVRAVAGGAAAWEDFSSKVEALLQFLTLLAQDPEAAKNYDRKKVYDDFLAVLGVDPDDYTITENEDDPARKMEQMILELEMKTKEAELQKVQAEIEKLEAETTKAQAETRMHLKMTTETSASSPHRNASKKST